MITQEPKIATENLRKSRSVRPQQKSSKSKKNKPKSIAAKKSQKSNKSRNTGKTNDEKHSLNLVTKRYNAIRAFVENWGKFPPTKQDWDVNWGLSTITMDQLTYSSCFWPKTLFSNCSTKITCLENSITKWSLTQKSLEDLKDLPALPGRYFKINEYFGKTRSKRRLTNLVKEEHIYFK